MLVFRLFSILVLLAMLSISPSYGGEPAHLYDRPVLEAEVRRYNRLIELLYRNHFQPHLAPDQRTQLDPVEFRMPLRRSNHALVEFSVTHDHGRPIVVMPAEALKFFEDLSTAFAWAWSNAYRFDTIDLYLAMLNHKSGHTFSAGRLPDPINALNVPRNALENARVDEMSLRLRNSGLAFILAQALGQIVTGQHNPGPLTITQIRARRMEADRFALDLLERARIIPMGVVIYLHARTFGESDNRPVRSVSSREARRATDPVHPRSSKRFVAMAQTIADQGERESDPERRESFLSLAERVSWIASVGENGETLRCLETVARSSTVDALVLTADSPGSPPLRWCR